MARVLAVLQEEPERRWQAREIAELLGDVTLVATYRQLARWNNYPALGELHRRGACAQAPRGPHGPGSTDLTESPSRW
ncbi:MULTISPECIES: hypothetical protein [unclassified Streptomyces]|uniref:hypothetical protein n=1 Tax=unclassified Streptomyces TaxID=2593676 RepID=UPI000F44F38F|nr:hypothetical protein [Streptomyces sp. I6]RNL73863.1 hypothetical protein EBF04_29340 [Streptomyces sp. I6]